MPDPMNVSPSALIGGAVVLVIVAVLLLRVGKAVVPVLRQTGRFLDDWQGEPDRPGVPGRPGVMEQLSALRDEQARTRDALTYDGKPITEVIGAIAKKQESDSARLDTLTTVIGHAVGKTAEERVEGHRAASAAWQAMEAVAHERKEDS